MPSLLPASSRTASRTRTLVALACASLLTACGGGSSPDSAATTPFIERVAPALDAVATGAPQSRLLLGHVRLDEPVADALIELLSPAGEVLATARSDAAGSYVLKLPEQLPRDFLVIARDGFVGGQPLAATLLLVEDDFIPLDAAAQVTVLTTLSARVLQAGLEVHGRYAPAQADAAVRSYLELSEGFDLRDEDVRAFDPHAFLLALGDVPFDEGVRDVARQIVRDPALVRPYRRVLLGDSLEEQILIGAGTSLTRRGLEYLGRFDHPVTEKISSWGMAALNWAKPDWGARFDRIDNKLGEMHGDITIIQRQVLALQERMNTSFKQVDDTLKAMQDQAVALNLRGNYVTVADTIKNTKSTVDALHRRYMELLKAAPTGNDDSLTSMQELLDELAADIRREAPKAILALLEVQRGSVTFDSASDIWYRLQAIGAREYPLSVGSEFFDAINQQQDYVAGIQLLALNLLLEALNHQATRHSQATSLEGLVQGVSPVARSTFNSYAADLEATQALVRYPRIDPGLVANLQTGRLFVRHAAAMRLENGCTRLHVAWAEQGQAQPREFQSPAADCDFRFANAVPAFNALQPFGHADWTIGDMPVFRWQRGRTNAQVAQELGYDFSALFRHGQTAGNSRVIHVENGTATLRMYLGETGNFGYYNPPLTNLLELQQRQGEWHHVFFSRAIPADPLAQKCRMADGYTMQCDFR